MSALQTRRERLSSRTATRDSADVYLGQVRERGRDSGSFTVINITQAGSNLTSPGQAKRTLFYLSKAVEMNNYDENAFVSRSRYKNDPANNSGEIYLDAIICWDVTERQ